MPENTCWPRGIRVKPAPRSWRAGALLGALLIVPVALTACGNPEESAGRQTDPLAARTPAADDPPPTEAQAVRPGASEFRIPTADFQSDPILGVRLFRDRCAQCHGEEALGTDVGPPLIHGIYRPSHHSNLAFYLAIARGVHQHHWEYGDMPPVPGVTGEDAAHIIAWIRDEQRRAGIE